MSLSQPAAESAITSLVYAYLLANGSEAKIPDFSSSFGHKLNHADKLEIGRLFERAKRQAKQCELPTN